MAMEFNWVKARAECSLKQVFFNLGEMVESDVKTANELGVGPVQVLRQHRKTIVSRGEPAAEGVRAVVFELEAAAITARSNGDLILSGRPRLDEQGNCLLEVNGQLYRLWQVCQMALEDLFFG